MPRITRYVVWQLLFSFAATLAGITGVMVISIMAKVGVQQGLGLGPIVQLLPYALPDALRFSVPATILMATCSVFGRMSADNEVLAIKAMGVSPRVLLRPALVLAACISVGVIWLNDVAVTWGAAGMRRVFAESVEGVVFRLLRTQRHYSNKHVSINVERVDGKRLITPTLVVRGRDAVTLVAREAELRTNLDDSTLSIFLTDCEMESGGVVLALPDTFERVIPLSHLTKREEEERRPSKLAMAEISDEAIRQEANIRVLEQELAARAAYQMILGDFSEMSSREWSSLHLQRTQAKSRLNKLNLEPWRRCAEGFSCLFIVMVGAPLAITMRTSNVFTTFATCFFPILCIYYPLLTWAVDRVKDGALPPYTVWIGNLTLLVLGVWLTRRVIRY